MIKALNFMMQMSSLNCKNSIDHLISIEINEEENKNAVTNKSLNRFIT